MGKSYRRGRLAEEVRKIVSEMLLTELRDPALSPVTSITDVEVSGDGSYAVIFVSVLGDTSSQSASDEEKERVVAGLNRAKGMIRKQIGYKTRIKHVPELTFKIDSSMEYGRHISKILDKLSAAD